MHRSKTILSAFLILAMYLIACTKDGEQKQQQQQDNHPPIANADNDTTIILPANTAILNGSLSTDPDNNIKIYQWTKISGPICNIANVSAVQTQVTNLTEGIYLFELKVTDASNLFDKDTMQLTVSPKLTHTTDSVNVYVVAPAMGVEYWKNDQEIFLENTQSNIGGAYGIAISDTNVYVGSYTYFSAYPGFQAALWKNGKKNAAVFA